MEVGELDLNRGRQEIRGGLHNHCHYLGVEEGGVTVEKEEIRMSRCRPYETRSRSDLRHQQGLTIKKR